MPTLSYLGPVGSHSWAALNTFSTIDEWTRRPERTIRSAFEAFLRREVEACVVPIENALEGSVGVTLDLLSNSEPGTVAICRETVLPITHALLTHPDAPTEVALPKYIKGVLSHPQTLLQCQRHLSELLPEAVQEPAGSTADAARIVSERGPSWAALASPQAAVLYRLAVRAADLSDEQGNQTRFVLLKREDDPPTGNDRTSIVVALDRDRPGGLHGILEEFASRGINLSRIESRPTRKRFGEYVFFIDLEAHRLDTPATQALEAIRARAPFLRILGSYPRWTP